MGFSRTSQPAGSATPINAQTGASYTFVLADAQAVVKAGSSSAQTYTIPPHSSVPFDVGATLEVLRYGTGTLTVAGGAGVTVETPAAATARVRYSTISAFQVAVDEWVLGGDLG